MMRLFGLSQVTTVQVETVHSEATTLKPRQFHKAQTNAAGDEL